MLKAKHQVAGIVYTSNHPVMASLFTADMTEIQAASEQASEHVICLL